MHNTFHLIYILTDQSSKRKGHKPTYIQQWSHQCSCLHKTFHLIYIKTNQVKRKATQANIHSTMKPSISMFTQQFPPNDFKQVKFYVLLYLWKKYSFNIWDDPLQGLKEHIDRHKIIYSTFDIKFQT